MKIKINVSYWIYVLLTLVFGFLQIYHMLLHGTQGICVSAFLLSGVFVALNLVLANISYKKKRSAENFDVLTIYWLGVILYLGFIGVTIYKADQVWDYLDNLTITIVLICTLLSVAVATRKSINLVNSTMKGVYSLISKAIPNTIMAIKIFQVGGQGLSPGLIIVYHVLVLLRILQIYKSILSTGWDQENRALMLTEVGNEFSWILVTVAWVTS